MRYFVLATDYDGTLARHGHVDENTIASLRKLKESGRIPILVTGRQIEDLWQVFPEATIFERIVAENGGVIYDPATRRELVLGESPPAALVDLLQKRKIPISTGRVILATTTPHETAVLEAVRQLGLELQLTFNKGAVMALPAGVNKASGLKRALEEIGISPHGVVGIGDAENDHAFLEVCECSVAVANALPALRERADLVTDGDHGGGVAELIDRLVATDLAELGLQLARHNIPLGLRSDGSRLDIKAYGSSILVAGTSWGGKSTLTTAFLERLQEKNYQFCIIDPEGDYSEMEWVVLGDKDHAPSASEVVSVLMNPDQSVVVNLIGLKLEERPLFFQGLLPHLQELRAKKGRPHWLFVDEAHHLLPESRDPGPLIPQSMRGIWLVTVHPEHVSKSMLLPVEMLVAIGASPVSAIRSFSEKLEKPAPVVPRTELGPGEAIVWKPQSEEPPFWIRSIPGMKERQRHKRKYAEGELPPERSFYFHGRAGKLNLRAQNLQLFLQIADGIDDATWLHHLSRGDYSHWFRTGIRDDELAAAAARVEKKRDITATDSRTLIRNLIEERYTAGV
jgi:HAD superfamily hydrolase (TIGR01484 family)